jgi:hypothetical protein
MKTETIFFISESAIDAVQLESRCPVLDHWTGTSRINTSNWRSGAATGAIDRLSNAVEDAQPLAVRAAATSADKDHRQRGIVSSLPSQTVTKRIQ